MRALGVAGRIGAGLLVILVLLLGALAIGGGTALTWLIEHPVSRLAGLPIRVDGPVHIRWGHPTRLVAENIRILNARWGSRPDMFAAQRAEIDIDPRSRRDGPRPLPLISLERAVLLLETSSDGRRNWDLDRAFRGEAARALRSPRRLAVHDGVIIFRSGGNGAERMLVADNLIIDLPEADAPIELRATGSFQQQPIRLSASMGPLIELRHPTRPYPVTLDAHLGESDLALNATATAPLALAGVEATLRFDGRRLGDLAGAFGLTTALPELHAAGTLIGGSGDWALPALTVKLGQSDVEGGITLSTRSAVPYAHADLRSSLVDLDDLTALASALWSAIPKPAPTQPSGAVIPAATIAAAPLRGLDIDVGLRGSRIVGNSLPPLDDVAAAVHFKDGVLALNPVTFGIAGGQATLGLTVDPISSAFALDADIRRVDLAGLIGPTTLAPYAKDAHGIAGGFARVRGAGASRHDFLDRIEGEAGLFAENGTISPALQHLLASDVLAALGLDGGPQAAPVDCMISSFTLKSGVASSTLPARYARDGAPRPGQGQFRRQYDLYRHHTAS